jgi:hypothetical protein
MQTRSYEWLEPEFLPLWSKRGGLYTTLEP